MLLDEPLSALDLKLRQHMRTELRAIQKRTNVTFIYITHDQGEALAMSDRVGIMSHGVLQQVGVPQEIYNNPANGFVASFVGENNIFPGRVIAAGNGSGRDRDGVRHLPRPLGPGIAREPWPSSTCGRSTRSCRPAAGGERTHCRSRSPKSPSRAISSTSTPATTSAAAYMAQVQNDPPRAGAGRRASSCN